MMAPGIGKQLEKVMARQNVVQKKLGYCPVASQEDVTVLYQM